MLQQTGAGVVAERFPPFMARFPTVQHLAASSEEDAVGAWAGLGYYRRVRSLRQAALRVMSDYGGRIPGRYEDLLALPGVGSYTAGAIASMAFGVPVAAVDGNVARLASRLFLLDAPAGSQSLRARAAERLMERREGSPPSEFNEALIELGALVCRPVDPRCEACPVSVHCGARRLGEVERFPGRASGRRTVPVLSARIHVSKAGRILMRRRPADASRLPGQWELPGDWFPADRDGAESLRDCFGAMGIGIDVAPGPIATARHAITRYRIRSELYAARIRGRIAPDFEWRGRGEPSAWTTETRKLLACIEGTAAVGRGE